MNEIEYLARAKVGRSLAGNIARAVSIAVILFLAVLVVELPFLEDIYTLPQQKVMVASSPSQDKLPQAALSLPTLEREKIVSFNWKYKGKNYSLDESLYDSYYQLYKGLPTFFLSDASSSKAQYEIQNRMFITPVVGDTTVKALAQKIKAIGEEHKLNEDQMVEFVSTFVQTIPYDQGKLDRRTSGLDGVTEKITYPYEVLYEDTGVCQDKSYLAYALLKELGFGVSIFLFPNPEDNHMAIGVQCPLQYSNYASGYCFVETTSLGNKIGMIPDLIPKSRIATSDVKIDTVKDGQTEEEQYQSLGNVEILNKTTGKEYAGIVATISTQRELERLRKTIDGYNRELKSLGAEISNQEDDLDKMEKKLKSLKKDEQYDDYNDLVDKYNKLLSQVKKDIKTYNGKIAVNNAAILQYRALAKDFYR